MLKSTLKTSKMSTDRNLGFTFDVLSLRKNPQVLLDLYNQLRMEQGTPQIERLGMAPTTIRVPIYSVELSQTQVNPNSEKYLESKFDFYAFRDNFTGQEHVALAKDIGEGENVPVRVHSSCITGEVFHATNCECHQQLELALSIIEHEGRGAVVWLNQEGRGNGLEAKVKHMQIMAEDGLDTVEAFEKAGYPSESRHYENAAAILKNLGIKSARLITNNPDKIGQIKALGIEVVGRIPCEIKGGSEELQKNLQAKKEKLGHLIS